MADATPAPSAVPLALRIAVASTCCLVISEFLQLQETSLSVYTAFLIMVLFPISSFQKGVERFVGRMLGLVYALLLVWYFLDTPMLYFALLMAGQLTACYVYLSGRLAYAALMAAIFIGVVGLIGLTAPTTAPGYVASAAVQLIVGEGVAFLVNFITGAERTLAIVVQGQPLLPLRRDWLNTAAMLSTGQVVTIMWTLELGLPAMPTLVSAMIIGITPGGNLARWKKAEQRWEGAILAAAYCLAAVVVLSHIPYFSLMVALVGFAMFLAAYLTKTRTAHSYVFQQMGMVVAMVLIADHGEIGSIDKALQRIAGVAIGLLAAGTIALVWPHTEIPVAAPPSPPPPAPAEAAQRR
jgi:uncharacterized membrane protein YccC